jgi:hypothetical protein
MALLHFHNLRLTMKYMVMVKIHARISADENQLRRSPFFRKTGVNTSSNRNEHKLQHFVSPVDFQIAYFLGIRLGLHCSFPLSSQADTNRRNHLSQAMSRRWHLHGKGC